MYQKETNALIKASHNIATAFIQKMYQVEKEEMDEIYFIWEDPTDTLWYGDEFWSLSTMYETLLHNYDRSDVWNWYNYSMLYYDEKDISISLLYFVRKYRWYMWRISWIAEQERAEREKNQKRIQSPEFIAECEKEIKRMSDEFIKNIK